MASVNSLNQRSAFLELPHEMRSLIYDELLHDNNAPELAVFQDDLHGCEIYLTEQPRRGCTSGYYIPWFSRTTSTECMVCRTGWKQSDTEYSIAIANPMAILQVSKAIRDEAMGSWKLAWEVFNTLGYEALEKHMEVVDQSLLYNLKQVYLFVTVGLYVVPPDGLGTVRVCDNRLDTSRSPLLRFVQSHVELLQKAAEEYLANLPPTHRFSGHDLVAFTLKMNELEKEIVKTDYHAELRAQREPVPPDDLEGWHSDDSSDAEYGQFGAKLTGEAKRQAKIWRAKQPRSFVHAWAMEPDNSDLIELSLEEKAALNAAVPDGRLGEPVRRSKKYYEWRMNERFSYDLIIMRIPDSGASVTTGNYPPPADPIDFRARYYDPSSRASSTERPDLTSFIPFVGGNMHISPMQQPEIDQADVPGQSDAALSSAGTMSQADVGATFLPSIATDRLSEDEWDAGWDDNGLDLDDTMLEGDDDDKALRGCRSPA